MGSTAEDEARDDAGRGGEDLAERVRTLERRHDALVKLLTHMTGFQADELRKLSAN